MQNNLTVHVAPLAFWQCACGGPDLSRRDYQHLSVCPDCTMLADAIADTLDDIQKTHGGRGIAVS
jgi:hypothetical protein